MRSEAREFGEMSAREHRQREERWLIFSGRTTYMVVQGIQGLRVL